MISPYASLCQDANGLEATLMIKLIIHHLLSLSIYSMFPNKYFVKLDLVHGPPLLFLMYIKSSEDETFFLTAYDAKQVKINQEKHLLSSFILSYQLTTARLSAHQGCSAGTN